MTTVVKLLVAIGVVLAAASPARADIGVIVLEPIGPLGFMTRVGHAGTYLSNICPDGSAVKMRLCRPGEHGGVVSKYTPFSEHEDYDWAIVPFEEYVHGSASPDLDLAMSVSISRRLGEIRSEKRALVRLAMGSKRQWRELDTAFQLTWRAVSWQRVAPEPLRQALAAAEADGQLSAHLLRYFESDGEFSVDAAGRGPWMALPRPDGTRRSTGVSRAQILAGDPRVAVLVLAPVIDYNLHASSARREDIAYMNEMFTLFRQASVRIRRIGEPLEAP